jgi:carboxypeptidase Taq
MVAQRIEGDWMSTNVERLRERLAEVEDIRSASELLGWDQQTKMPAHGAPQRAEALATLEGIAHEKFVSAEIGSLIETVAAELEQQGADPDSDDAALVKVARREWNKARRVPSQLASELAKASSLGQEAWVEARRTSDFSVFAPYLENNLKLARRYTDCFDEFSGPYDALLDDYEPEMTSAVLERLFTELRDQLVPLIAEVAKHKVDVGPVHGEFPVQQQRTLVREVVELMGFTDLEWRMDDAVHPFATNFGSTDVRITNRFDVGYLGTALYGGMHECGHGLYEAGIAPSLQRTILGHGVSLGVHESQSRMWENMVGRGRPFSNVLAPKVSRLFGHEISPEALFRAVNQIKPSLIRVEADEATYGLHIVVRFELEQELIEGRLAVADLPQAWNAKVSDYLGLEVPDDAHGVLQDVHWSGGMVGYFPTYALGNMIAGQLWRQANLDIPDLDDQIAAGELQGLREWLRENVHRHGAKYPTTELLRRVVGGPIEVGPFVDYLKAKLSDVYQVALA